MHKIKFYAVKIELNIFLLLIGIPPYLFLSLVQVISMSGRFVEIKLFSTKVLWSGRVVKDEKDEVTTVIHNLNQKIHKDPRVDNSLLPIADGLNLAMKI